MDNNDSYCKDEAAVMKDFQSHDRSSWEKAINCVDPEKFRAELTPEGIAYGQSLKDTPPNQSFVDKALDLLPDLSFIDNIKDTVKKYF